MTDPVEKPEQLPSSKLPLSDSGAVCQLVRLLSFRARARLAYIPLLIVNIFLAVAVDPKGLRARFRCLSSRRSYERRTSLNQVQMLVLSNSIFVVRDCLSIRCR